MFPGRHKLPFFSRFKPLLRFDRNRRRFSALPVQASAIEILEDRTLLSNISISDVTAVERSSGLTDFVFTVTRDDNTNLETVNFTTADGTASVRQFDYVRDIGTLSFAANGPLTTTITVLVRGDTNAEEDETFFVNLFGPTGGAVIADSQGIATILDDYIASLSMKDRNVAEGDSGLVSIFFEVVLDNATGSPFTVDYSTIDDVGPNTRQATLADNDYISTSGTLHFSGHANESHFLSVQVVGDTVYEHQEFIQVKLSNLTSGVTSATDIGIGHIGNDDTPDYAPTLTGPKLPTNDTTPTITWNGNVITIRYELVIYNVDRGRQVVSKLSKGFGSTVFTSPLLEQAEHQVFVRASFPGSPGPWSVPLYFDVVLGKPFVTVPGIHTENANPTIRWSAVDGAETYELLVYDIAQGKEIAKHTDLTGTSFTLESSLKASDYQVFVRAFDSFGDPGGFSSASVFTVRLPSPNLAGPGLASIESNPTINWSEVDGATTYDLLIYHVAKGKEVVNLTELTSTQYTTHGLEYGTHQAFVRAVKENGLSNFSSPIYFDVALGTATFTSPQANSTDKTPKFVWTEVEGAVAYELVIYDVNIGREIGRLGGISTTQYTAQSPFLSGNFRAYVRAFDSMGVAGRFEPGFNFEIVASVGSTDDFSKPAEMDQSEPRMFFDIEPPAWHKTKSPTVLDLEQHREIEHRDRIFVDWDQEKLWEPIPEMGLNSQIPTWHVRETDDSSRLNSRLLAMGTLVVCSARNLFMRSNSRSRQVFKTMRNNIVHNNR